MYRDQLAFVVPRGHRLTRQREIRIRDLGDESFVAHHVASPYRARVLDTFQKRRVDAADAVEMPTIDAIKRFVAAGHGVALLPAIAVEGEVARGDLVRVRVAGAGVRAARTHRVAKKGFAVPGSDGLSRHRRETCREGTQRLRLRKGVAGVQALR